jgi:hypothetical protein
MDPGDQVSASFLISGGDRRAVWHQLGTTDLYSTGFKIFGNFVEIMGSFERGVLLPPACEHYSRGVARAVPGHGNIPVSTSFAERRLRVTRSRHAARLAAAPQRQPLPCLTELSNTAAHSPK